MFVWCIYNVFINFIRNHIRIIFYGKICDIFQFFF